MSDTTTPTKRQIRHVPFPQDLDEAVCRIATREHEPLTIVIRRLLRRGLELEQRSEGAARQ